MAAVKFTLNGKAQTVDVPPAMPLLWVLRDTLGMTGTKFGCGMSLCGACTVHLNGQPVRSCVTPISNVAGKTVTTIEGLSPDRTQPDSAGLDRRGRAAVRLLPVGTDHDRGRAAGQDGEPHRRRYRRGHAQQHLPLRHLSIHPPRRPSGRRTPRAREVPEVSASQTFSRRGFLRASAAAAGGVMIGFQLGSQESSPPASSKLNAFVHVGTDDVRHAFHPQGGDGAGHRDLALHAAGRGTGVRLEKDPHGVPGRGPRVRPHAGRVRQPERAHLVRLAAPGGRRGARDARAGRGASNGASLRRTAAPRTASWSTPPPRRA